MLQQRSRLSRRFLFMSGTATLAGAAVLGDGRPVVLGIRGQVFTAVAGEKPKELAGHLAAPSAMCADGRGGLMVAEGVTGRVMAIAATGQVSEQRLHHGEPI